MKLLLTGATGKVGQVFLRQFLESKVFSDWQVTALCHNREVAAHDRVTCIKGSLSDRDVVATAMRDVTHVVHMASVKESPDIVMDISVKGMFWLLEAARQSESFRQFILIGGDCSVGHIFHRYDAPITESSERRAYPGCYALSKVLEEVMLEQYRHQYGLNGCCLRAPWIMEKDDFRFVLAFGEGQFGGPSWSDLLPTEDVERYAAGQYVPVLLDETGRPLKRNFVHVEDLARAILAAIDEPNARGQLFNIAMNEPVDYSHVGSYLQATRGLTRVEIPTPYFSNWLDNTKARKHLDWAPEFDLEKIIENAWRYERAEDDPRIVWYPG